MNKKKIITLFYFFILSIKIMAQVNNNCASATTLTPGTNCISGTLSGSNTQTGEVTNSTTHCGSSNFNQSVWYSFTANNTTMHLNLNGISLSGGGSGYFPGRLTAIVYNTSTCLPAWSNNIGCDTYSDGQMYIPLSGLTVGNTYLVQIGYNDGNGSQQVSFCIGISPAASPRDCIGAATVCSSTSFTGTTSGQGNWSDLGDNNDGCLVGERNTLWYVFSPQTSGTIGFTIQTTVDYDFALWGPYSLGSTTSTICPPSGSPLRCSFAATTSNTGLGNGATDNTETATGDGWVAPINVTAGEVYILAIDRFSTTSSSFTLNWNLSGGATLDCTVLPISINSFYGVKKNNVNPLCI